MKDNHIREFACTLKILLDTAQMIRCWAKACCKRHIVQRKKIGRHYFYISLMYISMWYCDSTILVISHHTLTPSHLLFQCFCHMSQLHVAVKRCMPPKCVYLYKSSRTKYLYSMVVALLEMDTLYVLLSLLDIITRWS